MKLHYLRIEGMGPFARAATIDFSRFDASGIFLLEGPTGSGKSSIIDAITFALYGDVARLSDASKDRLRSSYCAPNDPSRVECVFEVMSGFYRVTRTPSYVKPGRKTKVNATVQLERVTEDKEGAFHSVETLSRSHAEADAEITALVGLKKEQFLQTVVLPQGKFATFLSARSEARREILQDVFGTHIYQALQERFREAANEQAVAVDTARAGVNEARAQLHELTELYQLNASDELNSSAESTAPLAPSVEGDLFSIDAPEDDETLIMRLTQLLEHRGKRLKEEHERRKEALADARRHEQRAQQAASDLATRDSLVQRLTELEGQAEEITALRQELTQAREAEIARPFIEDFDASYQALRAAHAQARLDLDQLEGQSSQDLPLPESLHTLCLTWSNTARDDEEGKTALPVPLSNLRAHATACEKLRARLSDLLPVEEGLAEREANLAALAQRIADIDSSREQAEVLISELPTRLEQAQKDYAQAQGSAHDLPLYEEKLQSLRQRYEHARTAEEDKARIPEAQRKVDEAAQAAQQADAHARALRTAWMADAASALARELSDDTPCPVCGSSAHPSPATPQVEGEAISHAHVEEADAARQAADRAFLSHRDALAHLSMRVQQERLNANGSCEELRAAIDAAEADLQVAQQAASDLASLDARIEELREQHQRALTQSVELREQAAALTQQRDLLATGIAADRQRCHEAAAPFASLSAHDEALAARISVIEQVISSLTEWAHQSEAFSASAARLSQALSIKIPAAAYIDCLDAGIDPTGDTELEDLQKVGRAMTECRERLRSAEELNGVESRLDAYHAAVASARDGLKNPAFEDLRGDEDVRLVHFCEQVSAAEDAYSQALARHERAAAHDESAQRAIDRFRQANAAFEAAVQAAEPARRLHALASATTPENLTRTPLAAWVLMARFEEVLAAANPRLLAISQGRYELIRVDDDGSQSRKSGLGVAVVDHDTETTRLPSTLSGGESFYVSLSLALGLADVVTGENGGVELHTMFIDEGFGSLDAATLETVMAQLHRLRDSGRTVGVISHVHEMATLIPDQIQVRWSSKEGSTVKIRA